MISMLCEAICSVKGTLFCLGNNESKYTYAVTAGGRRRQGRIVKSKSVSEYYMVPRWSNAQSSDCPRTEVDAKYMGMMREGLKGVQNND